MRGRAFGITWKLLGLLAILALTHVQAEDLRFPAPEFRSGYHFPPTSAPAATASVRDWIDLGVLTGALGLASWLGIKKRSRRGVFLLMLFSLAYFGFYKQGCVCPIGSTQNVALALVDPHYAVPLVVALTFVLPLLFALFFGRSFCSSVCALGAIQDLVILKPVSVPRPLAAALGVIPFAYLGLAVLLAAVNTSFLICRFDPFIGFFRLSGNVSQLIEGAAFLVVGVFVARPYCRFLCPYGALLGLLSRFSRRHLTITPSECVTCRLCETSCPFDSIQKPNIEARREPRGATVGRLGFLVLMVPVLVALGAWVGYGLGGPLARANRTVWLAERVLAEKTNPGLQRSLETEAFLSSGTATEELFAQSENIQMKMAWGSGALGAFIGLVFSVKLITVSAPQSRANYEINKAACFSCARCCSVCPNDASHFLDRPKAPVISRPKEVVCA